MNLDVAVYKKICKKASDFTSDNTWENYYRRIYQIINCTGPVPYVQDLFSPLLQIGS